jgi:hypothetical protein
MANLEYAGVPLGSVGSHLPDPAEGAQLVERQPLVQLQAQLPRLGRGGRLSMSTCTWPGRSRCRESRGARPAAALPAHRLSLHRLRPGQAHTDKERLLPLPWWALLLLRVCLGELPGI